jgi:uncharacterized damage-inducible protein DinB
MEAPQYPVGPNPKEEENPPRKELIAMIEKAPQALREAVAGLSDAQLDTKYKNWTIRQIVHHLADSHTNGYIAFKLAITEDQPAIKSYDRNKWAELEESRTGSVEGPLALLEGLHKQWVQLMRTMLDGDFARAYVNPRNDQVIKLSTALGTYAWHGRHHTGQILWMREQKKV